MGAPLGAPTVACEALPLAYACCSHAARLRLSACPRHASKSAAHLTVSVHPRPGRLADEDEGPAGSELSGGSARSGSPGTMELLATDTQRILRGGCEGRDRLSRCGWGGLCCRATAWLAALPQRPPACEHIRGPVAGMQGLAAGSPVSCKCEPEACNAALQRRRLETGWARGTRLRSSRSAASWGASRSGRRWPSPGGGRTGPHKPSWVQLLSVCRGMCCAKRALPAGNPDAAVHPVVQGAQARPAQCGLL